MLLSAVLFDVDGTISETEELHRKSFNESFKEFNLEILWGWKIDTIFFNFWYANLSLTEIHHLLIYLDKIEK